MGLVRTGLRARPGIRSTASESRRTRSATMSIEVKLPGLGDGIEEADVLEVLVKEGDRVEKDQGLVEVETEKATVQVPSSDAGVVKKIHVKSGESIHIGAPIVTLETDAKGEPKKAPPADRPAQQPPKETNAKRQDQQPSRQV